MLSSPKNAHPEPLPVQESGIAPIKWPVKRIPPVFPEPTVNKPLFIFISPLSVNNPLKRVNVSLPLILKILLSVRAGILRIVPPLNVTAPDHNTLLFVLTINVPDERVVPPL